jgi:putative tryptophan/tyrosine transport system substrate-binding protein
MDRCRFLLTSLAGALAAPLPSLAQETKVWRIGFFYFGSLQSSLDTGRYRSFLQGMRELGYIEGKNFVVEARFADGEGAALPGLAAELISGKVDVIVATGTPVTLALRKATRTVPIVSTVSSDPAGDGSSASLARPGGNITGLSNFAPELSQKQVELLTACVPKLSRLAVLVNPSNAEHSGRLKLVESAARKVGMRVLAVHGGTPDEITSSFGAMARDRAEAVLILGDTFFLQQMRRIADLALKYRLPSVFLNPELVEAGGLMSYGPNFTDNFRRAASYVDKILKGAKPADLPIEQPTKFELVINLKTAKALGLTIPQSLLLRADQVIE